MGPSRYNHLSSFCQVGGGGAVFLFLRFCVFAFPFSVPVIRLKEIIPETLAFACFAALECVAIRFESWVRPLGLRSDGGCCPKGAAFPFGCLSLLESFRVISTARLRPLPALHLQPINVVVFNDP